MCRSAFPTHKLVLILPALAAAGCGGGQSVTPEAIAQAKQTWRQANIANYDLEWTSTGRTSGHYLAVVRNGKVQHVMSVLPDGREVELHPAKPSFYGVDGLFQVLEDEMAQLQSPTPFGQPAGTTAVLRFTTDPKFGYPRTYRRDVAGTPYGVAIDVVKFEPTPAAKPAPSS